MPLSSHGRSEDGRVILQDARCQRRARAQDTLQEESEVTCVRWHPTMESLFITSDARGYIHLRDLRMAFGPLKNRSMKGIVRTVRLAVGFASLPLIISSLRSTATP